MKWFDPSKLLATFFVVWLVLVSAYILLLWVLIMMIRYWYFVLLIAAIVAGICVAIRLIRRRFERW